MYKVQISTERFKKLREERGISTSGLARGIGSSYVQIRKLDTGHTTSFSYLQRFVPIFGLENVADLIEDPYQRECFLSRWRTIEHFANIGK